MNCPNCDKSIDEHEAGRCLDAWVGKTIMGLQRVMIDEEDGEALFKRHPGALSYGFVPQYSVSIAAAWEVERTISESQDTQIAWRYIAALCKYVGATDYSANYEEMLRVSQASPLLKCRAALKAVIQEKEVA